jgi:maltooligosyltrehalose synthase
VAFVRAFRESTLVVLAGRFFAQLDAQTRLPVGLEAWGNTEIMLRKQLPAGLYRDVFTGKTVTPVRRNGNVFVPASEAFAHLPIALLVNSEGASGRELEDSAHGK